MRQHPLIGAEFFDALTTDRPYKKAWSVDEAINHLKAESGKHFDPEFVTYFIAKLPEILEVRETWRED